MSYGARRALLGVLTFVQFCATVASTADVHAATVSCGETVFNVNERTGEVMGPGAGLVRFGELFVANEPFAFSGSYTTLEDGRLLILAEARWGTLSVRRIFWVPDTGPCYLRVVDVYTNFGEVFYHMDVALRSALDGAHIVQTSSGLFPRVTDPWWVLSDSARTSELGIVLFNPNGEAHPHQVTFTSRLLNEQFRLPLPPGGRTPVAIASFLVPSESQYAVREVTQALAVDALHEVAGLAVDGLVAHNFLLEPETGPHIRFDGPFAVSEGEGFSLNLAVGSQSPVGFSYDTDGDGVFGEQPQAPALSLFAPDGPSEIRIAVMVEPSGLVRYRSVQVLNSAPVIDSTPLSRVASLGVPYRYQVIAHDAAGALDTLTYRMFAGALGASLSASGLFSWTAVATQFDAGDDATFVFEVSDEDGGLSQQQLVLTVVAEQPPSDSIAVFPLAGAVLREARPTFIITAASDPEGRALQYFFEVASDPAFADVELSSAPVLHSDGAIRFRPEVPLANGRHFWRAWSSDGPTVSNPTTTTDFVIWPAENAPSMTDAGRGRNGCALTEASLKESKFVAVLAFLLFGSIIRRRVRFTQV